MATEIRPKKVPRRELPTRLFRYLYRGLRQPHQFTAVSNRLLRAMGKHPLVRMIIERRKAQTVAYCHPPRYRGDVGFDIVLAEEDRELNSKDELRRDEIIELLMQGGFIWPRPADGRPGPWAGDGKTRALPLTQAVALLVEDSLILDSAGIRIEKGTRSDRYPVVWFRPVDGANIRIAEPDFYERQYRQDVKLVEYVLLDERGDVAWELAWDEFGYWVRNPATEEASEGYGRSELEWAVDVLTGLVTSFRYNVSQFTENKLPRGILQVPDVDERILDEFITTLEMNVGGPLGHWSAIPVITVEGDKPAVQWIPLGERPSDMQWRDFIVFCINVLCSLYKISAEEVGFQSFLTRQATLQEADPETRILHGEDTGFVPLMESLAAFINEHIVGKFDDGKWRFVWRELGRENEARSNDLRQRRLSMGFTSIDEERLWADKPVRRLPTDLALWQKTQQAVIHKRPNLLHDPDRLWGQTELLYAAQGGTFSLATQVPVSPQLLQVWQMELAAKQQEAQEARAIEGAGLDQLAALTGGAQDGQELLPGAPQEEEPAASESGPPEPTSEEEGQEEATPDWPQIEDRHQRKSLVRRLAESGRRVIEVFVRRG
ncbi:MAG: hypothetical protein J7M26_03450 [Armatimonadetes bacterium]|nr:hypothetical protein [Armatimonadota bacterium]